MPNTSSSLPLCAGLCAATLLLACACQDVPKYHRSNGKFDEWAGYEGKNFSPSNGTVAAVDLAANTITISHGDDSTVYAVTPATRIIHEGTDIPLAQLPLHETVKYLTTDDKKQLISVWFGQRLNNTSHPNATKPKDSFL